MINTVRKPLLIVIHRVFFFAVAQGRAYNLACPLLLFSVIFSAGKGRSYLSSTKKKKKMSLTVFFFFWLTHKTQL